MAGRENKPKTFAYNIAGWENKPKIFAYMAGWENKPKEWAKKISGSQSRS